MILVGMGSDPSGPIDYRVVRNKVKNFLKRVKHVDEESKLQFSTIV